MNFPYRSQKTPSIKFHKNPSNNSRLVPYGQMDGRTDGQTWRNRWSLSANVRMRIKWQCHVDNLLHCNKVLSKQVRIGKMQREIKDGQGAGLGKMQREIKDGQGAGLRRHISISTCNLFYKYTGCPRRNVPDFRRVFLMLKYTDITQNTFIQSWTVTEIMAREKCGLLAVPRTAPVQLTHSAREGVLKWMLP